jgi:hypothetical protein
MAAWRVSSSNSSGSRCGGFKIVTLVNFSNKRLCTLELYAYYNQVKHTLGLCVWYREERTRIRWRFRTVVRPDTLRRPLGGNWKQGEAIQPVRLYLQGRIYWQTCDETIVDAIYADPQTDDEGSAKRHQLELPSRGYQYL